MSSGAAVPLRFENLGMPPPPDEGGDEGGGGAGLFWLVVLLLFSCCGCGFFYQVRESGGVEPATVALRGKMRTLVARLPLGGEPRAVTSPTLSSTNFNAASSYTAPLPTIPAMGSNVPLAGADSAAQQFSQPAAPGP